MSSFGGSNPLLLTSAAGGAEYEISRSLRFNSSDSAYLSRTPASAGNRTAWSWSAWVKRTDRFDSANILFGYLDATGNTGQFVRFLSDSTLDFSQIESGSYTARLITTQVFRDPGAWFHLLVVWDSANGTANSRHRIYINGTEVTTFTTRTNPSSSLNSQINTAVEHAIGTYGVYKVVYTSVYYADVHFIDGQALTPSSFTEVSATTGQLIPKAYSGTYGTNGFHLPFSDNSTTAALGTDTSGNNNTWTPNNFAVAAPSDYTFGSTLAEPLKAFDGNTATSTIIDDTSRILTKQSIVVSSQLEIYTNNLNLQTIRLTAGGNTYQLQNHPSNSYLVLNNADSQNNTPFTGTLPGPISIIRSAGSATIAAVRVDGSILTQSGSSANIDSLTDTPTSYGTDTGLGAEVRGNYCTINPLTSPGSSYLTISNGNLDQLSLVESTSSSKGTIGVRTGKWYWEVRLNTLSSGGISPRIGICRQSAPALSQANGADEWIIYMTDYPGYGGRGGHNSTLVGSDALFSNGDIGMFALDMDNSKIYFGKNGTWLNSGDPASGTGAFFTDVTGEIFPLINTGYYTSVSCNWGARPFAYTAPSGFKALCTANLPAPTIENPSTVMDVKLYTGNGSTQTISGLGFSPDLVWIKRRDQLTGYSNAVQDTVRGATKGLITNRTDAEYTYNSGEDFTAFTSDGFSLGTPFNVDINNTSATYVAWTWDAGTSNATNTSGTITSTVRANISAGFSVVSYTGTGSNATVGHGLGVAPQFFVIKCRTEGTHWPVYHAYNTSAPETDYLRLNRTEATADDNTYWNDTAPTSSVFSIGTNSDVNISAATYIAYCWTPVAGYSAFGNYTGTGSPTDGPFVYTGMLPRWILIKRTDSGSTNNWVLYDTARSAYNVATSVLYPNLSNAEDTTSDIDILSNGFRIRDGGLQVNASSGTYVWAAFAEHPFALARAR